MNSFYKNLTTVNFAHGYFASGVLDTLNIVPDPACQKLMLDNGLVFKAFKGGFAIYYDMFFAGEERSRQNVVTNMPCMRFLAYLEDYNFYNYTCISIAEINPQKIGIGTCPPPVDISNKTFLFSNTTPGVASFENQPLLHADFFASEADLINSGNTGATLTKKHFAEIILDYAYNVEETYYIRFQEKWTYWRHVLVSVFLKNLANPCVLGPGDNDIAGPPLRALLPNSNDVLVFTSKIRYPICQNTRCFFKLVDNYEAATGKYRVVKSVLPVPSANVISSVLPVMGKNKSDFSDIFL